MATNKPIAKLQVNGSSKTLSSFTLEAPENSVGYLLTAQVADPNLSITDSDEITFLLGAKKDGVESTVSFLETGKLAGNQRRQTFKGDTLNINAVNPLADRWALATREPEFLYDPDRFDIEKDRARSNNDVIDGDGNAIESELIAVAGLDLKYILHHVYVDKLNFTRVVTNVPNYLIRTADFSINESWHDAAKKFVAFFEPKFFADDNGQVFIIDPQRQLPAGFASLARVISPGRSAVTSYNRPAAPLVNAILLTYLVDDNQNSGLNRNVSFPPTVKTKIESESVESGAPGSDGYSLQITTHYTKQFFDDDRNVNKVTREVEYQVIYDTYAWDSQAESIALISTESQLDYYAKDWRLKTGHDRTISALVRIPDGGEQPIFIQVLSEVMRSKWRASFQSQDELTKLYSYTLTDGFVLIEGDSANPNIQLTKMPLLDANRTRNVAGDGIQRIEYVPISTVYERSRPTGTSQVTITLAKIDHLTPMIESSKSVQYIADNSVNLGSNTANTGARKTVTELIRDKDSETDNGPRVPLALNAGEIPILIAVDVAKRKLKRRGQPLATATVELLTPDLSLRRGSIRRIDGRSGVGALFIVTSFRIEGKALGTGDGRVTQTFEAIIVQND